MATVTATYNTDNIQLTNPTYNGIASLKEVSSGFTDIINENNYSSCKINSALLTIRVESYLSSNTIYLNFTLNGKTGSCSVSGSHNGNITISMPTSGNLLLGILNGSSLSISSSRSGSGSGTQRLYDFFRENSLQICNR